MAPKPVTRPGRRFPAGFVSRAAWLHRVFNLNRQRCLGFGADLAREPRRRRPRPGDTGCLHEVFIRMNGTVP